MMMMRGDLNKASVHLGTRFGRQMCSSVWPVARPPDRVNEDPAYDPHCG
jgi:hypothetical protein